MEENQKKAFDFAADTTKQLITIATGIIALMVTFSKDVVGSATSSPKILLAWTWAIFIFSILFGILTLMALTGTLQPQSKSKSKDLSEEEDNSNISIDINNGNIRLFSLLQILLFMCAVVMTAIFGYKSLSKVPPANNEKKGYKVVRKSMLNNDTSTIYIDTMYLVD